jgi:2-keto-4-pentenoate hydratase
MMKEEEGRIEEAARRLWDAGAALVPCAPVRDLIGVHDVACAYAVQERNIARRLQAGARPAGRKVGMTSVAVQQQLGYDQPNYGTLFADRLPRGETAGPGN